MLGNFVDNHDEYGRLDHYCRPQANVASLGLGVWGFRLPVRTWISALMMLVSLFFSEFRAIFSFRLDGGV